MDIHNVYSDTGINCIQLVGIASTIPNTTSASPVVQSEEVPVFRQVAAGLQDQPSHLPSSLYTARLAPDQGVAAAAVADGTVLGIRQIRRSERDQNGRASAEFVTWVSLWLWLCCWWQAACCSSAWTQLSLQSVHCGQFRHTCTSCATCQAGSTSTASAIPTSMSGPKVVATACCYLSACCGALVWAVQTFALAQQPVADMRAVLPCSSVVSLR